MKIIELMELLGYSPDKEGVCYGIAFTAVQAALGHLATDSTSLFKQFLHRAKSIQAFSENDKKLLSLFTHTWHSDQERDQEQKKQILNIKINDITFGELLAFCDTVLLYQGVISNSNNDQLLRKNLRTYLFSEQDYRKASKLFAMQPKDNQKEIFSGNYTVIDINDKKSFTELLKRKKESQEFVLTIQRPRHRMALICHDEKWHLVDHDTILVEEAIGKCDEIYESLKQQSDICNHPLLNILSYSDSPSELTKGFNTDCFPYEKQKYQLLLKDIIKSNSRNGNDLKSFMLGVQSLNLNLSQLKEIFLTKDAPEGSPFVQILRQQKSDSDQKFNSYLEGFKSLSLDVSDLLRCLAIEDDNGNNQIQNSLQNNHSFVLFRIGMMLKLFNPKEQALQELKRLLTHENKNKQNTLSIILTKGDVCAFQDYMHLIKRFSLTDTSELKNWLTYKYVLVNDYCGKNFEVSIEFPVLHWALKEGLSDIVEIMMHELKSFAINNDELKTLIVAKKNGLSGLFTALYCNHSETVEVFLSGVKRLNLSNKDFKEIFCDMLSKLKLNESCSAALINNESGKVLMEQLNQYSLASNIKSILPLQLYNKYFSEHIQEKSLPHLTFKQVSEQKVDDLAKIA